MKKNQNSFGTIEIPGVGECYWNSTNKLLEVFKNRKLIGSVRVVNKHDFNFDAMMKFIIGA